MNEHLYHLTGLCGEHWHPNAINVTFFLMVVCLCYRGFAAHPKRKNKKSC